ncbi:MAG: hypothetical protein IPK50_19660 [Fibrobacterota bacterium]|nr:MAG: hypothetical protein IPK50_19660 [Fibrobacterota bacterium]
MTAEGIPVGRHLREGNAWVFGWPGTGLDLRFRGKGLRADFSGSNAWIDVTANGTTHVLELRPTNNVVDLVPSDTIQDWTVSVRKRTEGSVGELVIRDLDVVDGAWLDPIPSRSDRLRMEFLGDSITCAYGCLEPDPTKGFDPSTEDFGKSWATVAASALEADLHAQAWSGIGVVRNWPGVEMPPLPSFWTRAVPTREAVWDLDRWMPDLVVVNLCSNDYGVPPFLPDHEFVEGYVRWMREVRVHRPNAPVVVVDGPLLKDDHPLPGTLTLVRTLLDQVAETMGGAAAGFHRLSLTTVGGPLDLGADYHPSEAHQRRIGLELVAFLKRQGLS